MRITINEINWRINNRVLLQADLKKKGVVHSVIRSVRANLNTLRASGNPELDLSNGQKDRLLIALGM